MEKVASLDNRNNSYGPALAKMLSAFPHAHEKHNGWYTHDDHPRFDFRVLENGAIRIHSWTGRTEDEILGMVGLKWSDISLNGRTYPGPTKDSLDLLDLAIAKKIHPHFLSNLGLQSGYNYHGRNYVKIPYYHADGSEHTKIKVRCKIEGNRKHYWDEDTPGEIIPYGLHKLAMCHTAGYLIIGEGESDAWTCWYHDVPFLGIPGANNHKCFEHINIDMLPDKIYVLQEPDQKIKLAETGQGFYKVVHSLLRKLGYTGEIFALDFANSGFKDPSELHIALNGDHDDFVKRLGYALLGSIPAADGFSQVHIDAPDQEYIPPCKNHTFAAKEISIQDIRDYMDMQQLGDAQLFARCFEGQVCYDSFEKEWYLWHGHHWQRDMHDHIRVLVSGHLGSVYLRTTAPLNEERARLDRELLLLNTDEREEAEKIKTRIKEIDAQIHAFIKRAKELRGRSYNTGVLYFAESLMAVPTRSDGTSIWDSLKGKIGVKNGVLDLHTGFCRDGQPSDYIRTFSPTEWQGLHAPCSHFEAFLQALFELREDKEEVIAFLQRLLGYALTGTCKEAIFALLYGPAGRNGKSTLFKIIFAALGKALAGGIAKELLVDAGKTQRANGPKPDLLELQGKRIAVASETQKGDKLDISAIKLYTGGDELGGRPMFGKHNVRFDQTHTLFLHTNFKPHADPGDEAFWARACLIEFNMRFVEDPDPTRPNDRKYDTGLERRIIDEELSGVLAYLVRGAMDYDSNGLKKPQSVKIASETYRVSEDTLQTFINDCCAIGNEHTILSSAFIAAYQEWSGDGFKLTSKELKKQMEKKGFTIAHTKRGNVYEGIKFVGEGQGSGEGKSCLVKGGEGTENTLHSASEAGLDDSGEGSEGKLHKVPRKAINNDANYELLNSAFTAFTGDNVNGHNPSPQAASQCGEGKFSAFTAQDLPSPDLEDSISPSGEDDISEEFVTGVPVCSSCLDKGVDAIAQYEHEDLMYCQECYNDLNK